MDFAHKEKINLSPFKITALMIVACGTAALVGCASKPVYDNSTHNSTKHGVNHQKIITNSRGVPKRYMIKQGDTVSKIAERYGLDWREIGRINGLDSKYTIYTGQYLTLWQDKGDAINKTSAPTTAGGASINTSASSVRSPTPLVTTPPSTPAMPSHTPPPVINTSLSVGSVGLMQFQYPVSSSNPVVRRYGTTTINGKSVTSQGMWFSGRGGNRVSASRSGTVIHADGNIDGAMIAIAHTDGFVSNYFHIQNATVKSGQTVQAGQQIAEMRAQPNGVALLEFRISRNSSYIDPLSVLK